MNQLEFPVGKQIGGVILMEKLPESINYHITEKCNYRCKFCFTRYKNYKKELSQYLFLTFLVAHLLFSYILPSSSYSLLFYMLFKIGLFKEKIKINFEEGRM